MKRKAVLSKKISVWYGVIMVLIAIICIGTYYSYAMFTVEKIKGNAISIVTGELVYEISGSDITNQEISVKGNEIKILEVVIKSENEIESKYKLYYEETEEVEVNVIKGEGESEGQIETEEKRVTIVIRNQSNSTKTIKIGVQGGLVNNELVLEEGREALGEEERYSVGTRSVTGGSVSVSTTSAYSGSTVTFTPASTSGFSYYGATLRNASGQTIQTLGTNERSFVMPDQAVTISPKWRKNDYIIAALDQSHVGSWTQKSDGANNATFTFNTSRHYLSVNFKTTANSRIYAWTSQTFDLTHYETYQVNVNESWSNNATHPGHSHFSASVSKTNTGTIQNGIGYQISQGKGNEVRFYLNVPISDLTGNYYLGIDFYNNGQAGFCDMTHATLIGKVYE